MSSSSQPRRTGPRVRRLGFQTARLTAMRDTPRRQSDLASSRPTRTPRAAKEILLVDPDPSGLRAAQAALRFVADIETCTEFRGCPHPVAQPAARSAHHESAAARLQRPAPRAPGGWDAHPLYRLLDIRRSSVGTRGSGHGSVFRTPVSAAPRASVVRERHASPARSTGFHDTRSATGFSWGPSLQRCALRRRAGNRYGPLRRASRIARTAHGVVGLSDGSSSIRTTLSL